MRKHLSQILLGLSLCLSVSSPAFAQAVIGSFSTTDLDPALISPVGLEFTATGLVIVNSAFQGEFYELTYEGKLRVFNPPGIAPGDPAWDGEALWYDDEFDRVIRRIDAQGSVLSSFSSAGLSPFRTALSWDGEYLWAISLQSNPMIYQLSMSGEVLASYPPPDLFITGLAWDGEFFFWGGTLSGEIIRFTRDGRVHNRFRLPEITRIQGVAFDGKYLYTTDPVSDTVYIISLSDPERGDNLRQPGNQ